ncbi:hypothetical protein MTO96_032338 [Rhipicephalus appendiculatus]
MAANSAEEQLPTPLKREKKFSSFRTASKKNEGPSPTVSPVKRSDGLPEYRDTSSASKPRSICFFLQSPKNDPPNEPGRVTLDQPTIKPENLDPAPEKRHTCTAEQPQDIPANAGLGRSLDHSSVSMKSLQKVPAGAPLRKNSITDAVSGLSDKVGHPTAPSLPPTDDSKCEPPACGAPPTKAGIPENLSTRRLGATAAGPGGLLRHYASRVNDGSWKWHSKTETSTAATESSSGSHTTSGSHKSTWASRAACLALCLVSVALFSFFVFYAIADAVFTRRQSLGEKFDPATVQPPDDGVARV